MDKIKRVLVRVFGLSLESHEKSQWNGVAPKRIKRSEERRLKLWREEHHILSAEWNKRNGMALGGNQKQIGVNSVGASIYVTYYLETVWRRAKTSAKNHEVNFKVKNGTQIDKISLGLIS